MKIPTFLLALCVLLPQFAFAEPIEVTVTDAVNAPVAGALVQIETFRFDDEDNQSQSLHQATSDAKGVAQFDLEPTREGGTYFGRAVAYKSGLALGGTELRKGPRGAIQLVAPTAISGRVRDENGAPIGGARVALLSTRPTLDQNSLLFYEESATAFEAAIAAKTDAKGAWTLRPLTANGDYTISIGAPGFARTGARGTVADGPVETTLRPEARATGRLLAPDGKPLGGVKIYAINGDEYVYPQPLVTDAQGEFRATGLKEGKWAFAVDPKNLPYVNAEITGLDLKIGDNDVPAIRLQTGVVVRGTVREAGGAPIDAHVTSSWPGRLMSATTRTDDKGAFSMRVPAGERSFSLQAYDDKYRDTNQQKTLTIAPDDEPQIAWVLERAPIVRGVIVDEAGAPVQAPFVLLKQNHLTGPSFVTDENGRFETPVDIEGEARIIGQVGKDGQFQIVGNNRVLLPLKGELKLVARLAAPVVFRARAVDGEGNALAGVELEALAMGDASGQYLRLRSDENGEIKSENLGKGARLQNPTATKKGYALRAPIEVVKDGENWTARPIIFDRRDASARGTILDVAGQPASGARVFAGGAETLSDDKGAWELENLPPGELLVSALSAEGSSFAAARTPIAGPLKLQAVTLAPDDLAFAQRVLDELKADAKNTNYRAKDRLSLPINQDFVAQVEAANATPNSSPVRLFYQLNNETDSPETGDLESVTTPQLLRGWLAMSDGTDRITAASALMEARPDWKDAAGASDFVFQLESDVEGELAGANPTDRKYRVEGLFALAAALETLGQTESAERALKNALDWTFKLPDTANNGELGRDALLTRGIGAFGNASRLFEKLLNYLDPESYWHHHALAGVIVPTVRARGLAAALPYIEQLQQLPDSRPALVQGDEMPYSPASQMPQIIENAVRAGGQSEPALALKLAQNVKVVPNRGNDDARSRALIEAAFGQTPVLATEIWRAQVPQLDPIQATRIAARIAQTDQPLARELYQEARARLEKQGPNEMSRYSGDYTQGADFAFYEAQFEPARARYRLEKAWPVALRQTGYAYQFNKYVLAMARLNPQRALEMAREIPDDKEHSSFNARYALARALAGEKDQWRIF